MNVVPGGCVSGEPVHPSAAVIQSRNAMAKQSMYGWILIIVVRVVISVRTVDTVTKVVVLLLFMIR